MSIKSYATEKQVDMLLSLIRQRALDFEMFKNIGAKFSEDEQKDRLSKLSVKQAHVVIQAYYYEDATHIDAQNRVQYKRYNRSIARSILTKVFN